MNTITWNKENNYYAITNGASFLGYIYPNGALVRNNGNVEFYATVDAAYAAI